MAFKTFNAGDVLTASDVNTYLMKQAVIVCTSGTRPSSPVEGMVVYETDTDRPKVYNGSQWIDLSFPTGATVDTLQTTGNTSYVDLTTSGPAVTVVTGTRAKVHISAKMFNSGLNSTLMSFAISGASTVAASDTKSLLVASTGAFQVGITYLITGLTTGSNTFTAKYRVTAGTGTFEFRNIHVRPA